MPPSRSLVRWIPALFLLMLFHGLFLFFWVQKNSTPLAWDQAIHTKAAMDYRDRISQRSWLDVLQPTEMNYPPLYHLALIPSLYWSAEMTDAGVPVNFFYLCVLIVAVFLLGADLMGPWEGFTAAAMASCYPLLFDMTRTTLIDLSLTAWIAAAFLCLVRSRDFSSAAWSLLFGLSLGLSMLTKWTALGYVLVPMLAMFWPAFRERKWLNVALALAAAGLVMAPWYVQNVVPMLVRIPKLAGLPPASQENLTGLANVFWYPLSLRSQLGSLFLFLLLPGLAAVLWRPKLAPVVLWFFGSMVLFSLIRNKNVRYFAPALPAAALLSVAWLPSLRRLSYGAVLIATFFFFFSYNASHPPIAQDWHHAEIIQKIEELRGNGPAPASVLVLSDEAFFHGKSLALTARSKKIVDISFHGPSRSRPFEFADFVLFKTGSLGPAFTLGDINKCAEAIRKPERWFTESFKEVGRWPLPENSEAVLYQCDPHPQNISDPGLFNLSLKELELPHIKATGVELHVTPLTPADTKVGRFKELLIRCDRVVYQSIEFRDVLVRLSRPQINLPMYFETSEIQLCSLGAIEPHATIDADVLLKTAADKARWLKNPAIQFDGPLVKVTGQAGGVPISLSSKISVAGNRFTSRTQSFRVAGISVPLIFVRAVLDQSIDLRRGDDWYYDIDIADIRGNGRSLRLGS